QSLPLRCVHEHRRRDRGRSEVKPFRYARATEADSAIALLAEEPRGKFLGGGTNLVDLMRLGVETPELLVDVTRLAEDRIEPLDDGGVRVGAAVTNSGLAADATVRERFPLLADAVLAGA